MAEAQLKLGHMYEHGEGVSQDYIQAHMWLNVAAANGNEKGRDDRNQMAKRLTPSGVLKAQRLAREWLEEYGG